MADKASVVFIVAVVIIGIVGLVAAVRNIATDSIGELNYMLREAKKRQEICYTKEEAQYIEYLEKKIQNHWGRKLVRKNCPSIFDRM